MATFSRCTFPTLRMERLELPEAFRVLPQKIQGTGIEVFLLDASALLGDQTIHHLQLHTLLIILEGSLVVTCNDISETLQKDEAIMMKKESIVQMQIPPAQTDTFHSLALFFDEPSLRYALLPFELPSRENASKLLKIPLNEKIKVFTDSILLYYKSTRHDNNWTVLFQNKLRELVWIFFHTDLKDEAKQFFSTLK